jgi:hypothetical protein
MDIVLNVEMRNNVEAHRRDDVAERWDDSNNYQKLSGETLNYLLQQFSNIKNNERRRYLAWRYWAANIDERIGISAVQSLIQQSDPLFNKVLIWRIKRHDTTALRSIEKLITKKPWLVELLAEVWNEESKSFFVNWFGKQLKTGVSENIASALELLQRLDNEDACQMLVEYWEQVKFTNNAIETALFLSSSETRELADKEIKRLGFVVGVPMPEYYSRNMNGLYVSSGDGLSDEKKKNLLTLTQQLNRFSLNYGPKYVGEPERLTRTKIESLLPYLNLFNEHNIYHFASKCLQIGAEDLCFERFYPLLYGHLRSRIRFTIDDLKRDIIRLYNELVSTKKAQMSIWIEDPEKHGINSKMLNKVLHNFSEQFNDADAFFIIAQILERVGTRDDISLIDNLFSDLVDQTNKVRYWKENAIFAIKRKNLN